MRRLCEADDAVRGLALEDRVARDAVPVRIGLALVDQLGRDDVDGHAVLGVHHDQAAVLVGLLHGPEDGPVVAQEDARVGGEELEVGDALVDQLVHLGQRAGRDVRHDHVEAVVDGRVAFRLGHPRVEPLAQRLALRLDGKVEDRRRAAERGRASAGLERVLGEGAAEGQLHVRVDVDRARDHVLARRIDGLVETGAQVGSGEPTPDSHDLLAIDQDVSLRRSVGVDDGAVRNECSHAANVTRRGKRLYYGVAIS